MCPLFALNQIYLVPIVPRSIETNLENSQMITYLGFCLNAIPAQQPPTGTFTLSFKMPTILFLPKIKRNT